MAECPQDVPALSVADLHRPRGCPVKQPEGFSELCREEELRVAPFPLQRSTSCLAGREGTQVTALSEFEQCGLSVARLLGRVAWLLGQVLSTLQSWVGDLLDPCTLSSWLCCRTSLLSPFSTWISTLWGCSSHQNP